MTERSRFGEGYLVTANYGFSGSTLAAVTKDGFANTGLSFGVVPAPSDKVLVGNGTSVVRVTSTGYVDTTYGTGGVQLISNDRASIRRRADGRVIAGGKSSAALLTAEGELDPSFGNGGIVGLPVGETYDEVIVGRDGKPYRLSTAVPPTLLRYWP